jgi:hypothetical protein
MTSRRTILAGLAAGVPAALGAAVPTIAAAAGVPPVGRAPGAAPAGGPTESRFLQFATPEDEFRAHFRYERDLQDQSQVVTWYHFTVYAVPDGERPQPIVRYEGMEFSYFRRLKDLTWRIHAHNVSYPRRLDDGAFADEVPNPVTGARVRPTPMVLLEDPGVLYGPQGYLPLDAREVRWLHSIRTFRIDGDSVVVDHVRPTPDGWPKTFIEASQSWAPRSAFDDPRVTSLPCGVSGFYVFPWPKWMQMGERKGHMIGSWLGRKLSGVEELPVEFSSRIAREYPALLKPRWSEFDRPMPFKL